MLDKSRVTAVPKQGEIMSQFDNVSVVKQANVYFDVLGVAKIT